MKVTIELDGEDAAETVEVVQRLVTLLEKLVDRLEATVEVEDGKDNQSKPTKPLWRERYDYTKK